MAKPPYFRKTLDGKLKGELLGLAMSEPFNVEAPANMTLVQRITWHQEQLALLVKKANEALAESSMVPMIAEHQARELNKRGEPRIFVDDHGDLVLEIGNPDEEKKKKRRSSRKSLPHLQDLRDEATELGIDITHLGAKRRAIYELIEEVKARKTAPPPEADSGPMSADLDEVKVSTPTPGPKGMKPSLPKRLRAGGFLKTGDPVQAHPVTPEQRPNLSELVESAADQDLRSMFAED